MWKYEKRLQYPVKIKQSNPQMAQFIMSQYGGPDGEIGASMRYLSQRYSMPYDGHRNRRTGTYGNCGGHYSSADTEPDAGTD